MDAAAAAIVSGVEELATLMLNVQGEDQQGATPTSKCLRPARPAVSNTLTRLQRAALVTSEGCQVAQHFVTLVSVTEQPWWRR